MPSNVPMYRRVCSVEVSGIKIDQLRISFDVEKDFDSKPNRAHISVYNLAETTRNAMQEHKSLQLRLIAGYEDVSDTLFLGDVTHIISGREGTEWVTKFSAGDGVKRAKTKRVSTSTKAAGGTAGLLKTLLGAFGSGEGNFAAAIAKAKANGEVTPELEDAVAHGNVAQLIQKYSKDCGMEFSSQDGVPTFALRGSLVGREAVVLSPSTGLIGSPELSKKGLVKAQALIQKGFTPGRGVQVDSRHVKGLFQVHKVKYTGDTHGQPWYADLELLTVKG